MLKDKDIIELIFDKWIFICVVVIWVVNVVYLLITIPLQSFFILFFSAVGLRLYVRAYLERQKKKEGDK